jgi:putative phosphoesterase
MLTFWTKSKDTWMRIALLADIHGNLIALDAVLTDIQSRGGVDGYWILGDLCAIGYDPAGVLERLDALPNAVFTRGNADRFVITGDRPAPTLEEALKNPTLIPTLVEVAGSFGWTQGYLAAHGWLDWLKNLPFEYRLTLPDGTHVLLVHAAPGTDDGVGLNPALTNDELQAAIAEDEAYLICVGHFHVPMNRSLDSKRIINPGSVSNSFAPDLRASYAILTADEKGYHVAFHRADYDRMAVIEEVKRSGNPGAAYIIRFMEGKVRASWLSKWDGVSYLPFILESES